MSDECKFEALKDIGRKQNKSQFEESLAQVDEIRNNPDLTDVQKAKEIDKIVKKFQETSAESKRRAIIQHERDSFNQDIVSQFSDIDGDAVNAVESRLTHNVNGVKMDGNLHTSIKAEINNILPRLIQGLDETELRRFQEGKYDLEIEALAQGKADGIKISKEAKALYERLNRTTDEILQRKNDVGFTIRKRKGYVGRQVHKASEIVKMGPDGYEKVLREHFEFMGKTDEEVSKLAGELYAHFSDTNSTYFGSGKTIDATGRRFEFARDLKFKSPEAAVGYRKLMGDTNIFQNLVDDIRRDSREVAAARLFGPNYRSGFDNLMQEGLKLAQSQGEKAEKKWKANTGRLERYYQSDVLGSRFTGEGAWADASRKVRQFTDIKLLGTAALTTLSDLSLSAGVLSAHTGRNYFSTLGTVVKENFKLIKSKKERIKLAATMDILMEDIIFDMTGGRAENIAFSNGRMDRAHKWFMDKTLLPAQSSAARGATAKVMGMSLAMDADKSFDQLYPGTREKMGNFGISPDEWDALRQSKTVLEDGAEIITASDIKGLEGKALRNLQAKYSSFLTEIANTGSPTPGVKQHAIKSTLDPNSATGVIMNFVLQYKSFVLSMPKTVATIAKTGAAERGAEGLAGYNYKQMAGTIVAGMGFGAASLALKDIAKGREVREFNNPEDVMEIFAQSGLGMIYFDMMSSDYSKGYRALSKDVAGPAFGTFDDFGQVLAGMVRGNRQGDAKNILRTIERNTPAIPFTKGIINKNVFDLLNQKLNTGAKRKKNSINEFLGLD